MAFQKFFITLTVITTSVITFIVAVNFNIMAIIIFNKFIIITIVIVRLILDSFKIKHIIAIIQLTIMITNNMGNNNFMIKHFIIIIFHFFRFINGMAIITLIVIIFLVEIIIIKDRNYYCYFKVISFKNFDSFINYYLNK